VVMSISKHSKEPQEVCGEGGPLRLNVMLTTSYRYKQEREIIQAVQLLLQPKMLRNMTVV